MKKLLLLSTASLCILATAVTAQAVGSAKPAPAIGINVLLNRDLSPPVLADLSRLGTVLDVMPEIRALTMQVQPNKLSTLASRPYVAAASPDAAREGAPVDGVEATSLADGLSTWNLDMINVTQPGLDNRTVDYDGTGVYVAVLDTGLLDSWRMYFPQERIASGYARSFGGGGGLMGTVSSQPNKWEHDQNSHGTHVTSTILGYQFHGASGSVPINGVAPMATVIPVKVLNQNGSGWSSVIARGILYVAHLKEGPLAGSPIVINMSLGGPRLDPLEKAAIDYAIGKGVIIVAAASNTLTPEVPGMHYPGAYDPVISVAAAGWTGEWNPAFGLAWWYADDVPDPSSASDVYIADFSCRAKAGQDLDVAAPGAWVVGPYQLNSGQLSYYFLDGTSMATPHVAGIVALMAQAKPSLSASEAEGILESTALLLPDWGSDAAGAGLVLADEALSKTLAP